MKAPFLLAALAGCSHVVRANVAPAFVACYSNPGTLKKKDTDPHQSSGVCHTTCVNIKLPGDITGYSVMGMTSSTDCYCGQYLPNSEYKVDDSKCTQQCPGYGKETCGTRLGEYISVYITGLDAKPGEDPAPSSSSSSSSSSTTSSSSSSSSSSTSEDPHSFESAIAPTSSSSSLPPSTVPKSDSGSGVNKAGVAAGVVVGVVVVALIGVGAWIFLRRKRRQKIEEDYRKSAAVRGFVQKPASDHRLDPSMVQRRDSVGSIADNQDYSRRILKVTNPDG